MKKYIYIILFSFSALNAELPSLSPVWKAISEGNIPKANRFLDDAISKYTKTFADERTERLTPEQNQQVLHFHLIRFYISYLQGLDSNTKMCHENIQRHLRK